MDLLNRALASVRESLGMSSAPQGAADIEMEAAAPDVPQADNGLKGDARTRVEESLKAYILFFSLRRSRRPDHLYSSLVFRHQGKRESPRLRVLLSLISKVMVKLLSFHRIMEPNLLEYPPLILVKVLVLS